MLIFIIGYMGSGKTTFGKRLANKLGYRFIDLDDLMISETGYSISDFFKEFGEDLFRKKERECLLNFFIDTTKDIVIATGGGTPCYADNMDVMNEHGVTVFLDTPLEIILERINKDMTGRPLLKDIPAEERSKFIKEHLEKRRRYYSLAQIRVQGDKMNEEEVCKIITKNLRLKT